MARRLRRAAGGEEFIRGLVQSNSFVIDTPLSATYLEPSLSSFRRSTWEEGPGTPGHRQVRATP